MKTAAHFRRTGVPSLIRGLMGATFLVALAVQTGSAATNFVKIVNYAFQPQFLTNHPGDTVVWTNSTPTPHDAVSSNSAWTAPALFTSPGTYSVTLPTAGTYGYFCSLHRGFGMTGIIYVQAPPNQPPTVALTNPASGIIRAAPANLVLGAAATDPDGTVASVQFFSGTTSLGTSTTRPYSLAVNNLTAGTYLFSARAVDNGGLSATSAVVSVSVVEPGTSRFATNLAVVNGRLPLRVSVTPGLNYALETSLTLTNWSPFTNFLATNALMSFSAPVTVSNRGFFRARRLPNP